MALTAPIAALTLKPGAPKDNWAGCQRIEIFEFNYDGYGGVITKDDDGDFTVWGAEDLASMLFGDNDQDALYDLQMFSPPLVTLDELAPNVYAAKRIQIIAFNFLGDKGALALFDGKPEYVHENDLSIILYGQQGQACYRVTEGEVFISYGMRRPVSD